MLAGPVSGSSSRFIPCSHALTSSARIPDAPPAQPFVNSWAAALISLSVGVSLSTGIRSMLIGMGSPGESLRAYNAIRSAVCHSIVCGQGRVVVSNAARYHPLRWQNASWTLPPANSCSMHSPTWAVLVSRSPRSAVHICRCIVRAAVWHSLPVRRSMVLWLIMRHVSSEIQSLPRRSFGSSFLHVDCSASTSRVNLFCGSGGSRRGRRCRC
jgi:hypothetical protein